MRKRESEEEKGRGVQAISSDAGDVPWRRRCGTDHPNKGLGADRFGQVAEGNFCFSEID